MNITKTRVNAVIVPMLAELADIAAAKDIDLAVYVLGSLCREFGVDPESIPKYVELRSL